MIKNSLYYKDGYLKEFEAVVKECIEEDKKIKIILDNTAFYPEGGGQPSDTGFIDNVRVLKVEEKENEIYHIVDKKINVGKKVFCKINFEERFQNMQNHTAEHIVSGIICKKYNTSNVGFHIGKDFVTLDFKITLSEKQLREIESMANNAIYENIEVISKIYTPEEIKSINYRSKIELKEEVRLVKINKYDICACCGVHVKRTGEIGIIKLLKSEKYKSGIRIYMLAGKQALENYNMVYNQISKISSVLSLKLDEVEEGVSNLIKEIEKLKKDKNNLTDILFENEINNMETKENIILIKNDLNMKDMKKYCLKLKKKTTKIAGIICNGRFLIMSDNVNLKEKFEVLKENLDIKGGGNALLIQGQINESPYKLIELLEKY
ncbi:MAG TPA: hypothetical protein IAD08_04715 [Candidatus Scatovivens faecipullorum]|nr:hypothetical protein [Candidatus Scatovivens faecipullorum]